MREGLCNIWNVEMSSSDRTFYSLHTLASIIGEDNALQLPAFLIKLQVAPATLLKKSLWHSCFPVNFAKFLRTPFL